MTLLTLRDAIVSGTVTHPAGHFRTSRGAAAVVAAQAASAFRASSRGKYGDAAGSDSSRYRRPASQLPDSTAARRRHATASARSAAEISKFSALANSSSARMYSLRRKSPMPRYRYAAPDWSSAFASAFRAARL